MKGQQTYREFTRQSIQTLLGVSVEKFHLTSAGFTIADKCRVTQESETGETLSS